MILSFGASYGKLIWEFIDIYEFLRVVDLLGIGRVLKAEILRSNLRAGLPVADLDAVLRRLVYLIGSDDISAGIRVLALCDPDLPVDFFGPKREMIALSAANHAAAKVLRIDDFRHQLIVDICQEEISARDGPV